MAEYKNSHDQIFIRKLTDIVLSNLKNEDFGVNELARESGLSPSGLNRRLRKITDKNITHFIREVRLKKALEMLQNGEMTASEVAYNVGFSSPAYFNTCFHEYFGFSPGSAKRMEPQPDNTDHSIPETSDQEPEKLARNVFVLLMPWVALLTLIIVTAVFIIYPRIFKRDILSDLRSSNKRISIAVLPFQNLTNDTSLNSLQDWIQDMIISNLTNYEEELEVRQVETVRRLIQKSGHLNVASITPDIAGTISRKLKTNVFVYGNIKLAGSTFILTTRIINSKTNEIIKSFQAEGLYNTGDFTPIIGAISIAVKDFLILAELKANNTHYKFLPVTSSPEAYQYYVNGDKEFFELDFETASEWFLEAIRIDSNFVGAIAKLSYSFYNLRKYNEAKIWCRKAIEKRDLVSIQLKIYIDLLNATIFDPPESEIKFARQLLRLDDQLPTMLYRVGVGYNRLFQYNKAIPEFEKSIEINKRWGLKPDWILTYIQLGTAYHKTGEFRKEKRLYRKAERDFPDDPAPIYGREAILSFSTGDTLKAERYISKYQSVLKESLVSEPELANRIASVYSEAGILDKAENYYRKALSLEQSNPVRIKNLAYFLIDNEVNLNEGLSLSEKALEMDPEDYVALDCKGWCLYKLGKPEEALQSLEKSWKLKPVYWHRLSVHLGEVRKHLSPKN